MVLKLPNLVRFTIVIYKTYLGTNLVPKKNLKNCFSIKQANLNNYNLRKVHEAILVTLEKPILNAQVAHRNLSII